MNYFLQSASFIFHPLLMPLVSVGLYFKLTPKFIEPEIIKIKTYAIIIITILIPLISFFLLKNWPSQNMEWSALCHLPKS